MRIALANLNPTVGDLVGNADQIAERAQEARDAGASVLVLPELALSGYPPRDLLHMPAFVDACESHADRLGAEIGRDIALVLGMPLRLGSAGPALTNSLLVYHKGERVARYDKRLLPTYDVFDEDRYFTKGGSPTVVEIDGVRVGLSICEDLWRGVDVGRGDRYADDADPVSELVSAGAQIIINPSASPFVVGKHDRHREIVAQHARRHGVPVLAVNQLGGNDELVFDGSAWAVDGEGRVTNANHAFSDELVVVDTENTRPMADAQSDLVVDRLLEALTLGVRDYARKTGFSKVCLGLSGGIDSALTAAIACRALGAENVTGIAMPGKYSSDHSVTDAEDLAERLGCRFAIAPIEEPYAGYESILNNLFGALDHAKLGESLPDITEENLQSRVRGAVLMALSNRTGALLLTTGNKSELAVGYCTLYGDMNGGLGVLNDVPKNLVYALSRYINDLHGELGFRAPPIPENTITKPPSAELAPDQRDLDSLPPYDVLDEIVRRHVELHQLAPTIIEETGFDARTVERIVRLIAINEYKRKQTPVGLKVTGVAFGTGRRMPIAQRLSV
ncbi:MAG: NAD+ synthase [Phycisphaera sp.]|nr:MAG: NAD+ synthase [Phycisphaera sp.]